MWSIRPRRLKVGWQILPHSPHSHWPRLLASSPFNGVYWDKRAKKFRAEVLCEGKQYSAGYFLSDVDAAHAFDEKLRGLCPGNRRLKKSLNFPTQAELQFSESPHEARARALARQATGKKEAESFNRLRALFNKCSQAAKFEIVAVSGASKVDAIFQLKGSNLGGLPLQLKSASPSGHRGMSFLFQRTQGYQGMLLLFIPLQSEMLWSVAGNTISQTNVRVTLGSLRDQSWRVQDIGCILETCFQQPYAFPHVKPAAAALLCSISHRKEEQAHRLMVQVLHGTQCELERLRLSWGPVDSVLKRGSCCWNVQEKASSLQKNGARRRYAVNLWKHGGALGSLAYTDDDFHLLLVAIMGGEKLHGMYVLPVSVLAEHKLVGHKPRQLVLYPPWAPPVQEASKRRNAWQLEHFVDVRDWDGRQELPAGAQSRLLGLLQQLDQMPCHALEQLGRLAAPKPVSHTARFERCTICKVRSDGWHKARRLLLHTSHKQRKSKSTC